MTLMLQCRVIALLLAAALVTACGGGATSEGIGGGGGGGGATGANAFLSGLVMACGNPALTTCNNMQLIVGEGFAPPPPGFVPGAAALPTNPLFNYTSTQSALVDAITVTPTAVVTGVTITVNGIAVTSGATTPPIALAPGVETEIDIVVTGLNGVTQLTYVLFVTRLALDNADLATLSLSSGPLTPAFSRGTVAYANTVAYSTANVRVTASPLEATASFQIAGQPGVAGEESALIPVVVGDNAIEIVVTALDGVTTKTYTITVTRRGSSNLSALSLSGLTEGPPAQPVEMFLDPAFVATSTRNAYTVLAENRAVEVVVTATAEAPGAVIRINGIETATGVASAPIPLPKTGVGDGDANTINVVVTHPASGSGDPLTRTYTLSVFRQLPPLFEAEAYLKPFDEGAGFESGISVALSGDGSTLAVGAPAAGAGAVYVYLLDNGSWTEQGPLLRPATLADGDSFGQSVALSASGDTLAVGAPARLPGGDPGENPLIGAVYVFIRQNGVWSEQALIESFKLAGDDSFGYSVALSGDGLTLAVGAPDDPGGVGGVQNPASVGEDALAPGSGAVYVYTFDGAGWSPQSFIKAPAPKSPAQGQEEFFGHSVAVSADGNLLAVGMPGDSSNATGIDGIHNPDLEALGQLSGAVRLYRRDAATWQTTSIYVKAQVNRSGNRFGTTVAFSADGRTLAVGEPPQSSNTRGIWDSSDDIVDTGPAGTAPAAGNSGAAYIFRRDVVDDDWFQQAFFKASNTRPGARFGTGIALSATGDAFVVGAPGEGSAATTIDGNQLNTSAPGSGAAYAFVFGAEAEVTRTPKVTATPASPAPEPVPPDPAVGVTATAGDGKITLSWTPLRGAISYNVYLSDKIEVSPSEFTTKFTDVSSPFDVTGLTNGVAYYAVVTFVSRVWTQTAYLKAPNSTTLALMGTSVALSAAGDRIAAGALGDPRPETGVFNDVPYPTATTAPNRGAAYLFQALPVPPPP